MRRFPRAILALVLLSVGGIAGPAGCGGPDEPRLTSEQVREKHRKQIRGRRGGGGGGAAQPAAQTEAPDGVVTVRLDNPKWDLVEPHFQKYLAQKHTTPKDAFAPQVTKFIEKPTIQETEPDEAAAEEEEEPRGPLQQYAISQYKLQLIMSGTAVPKAVVLDPKGQAYVIQRDTRLGDKGGIVTSITQYMVVVEEPDTEEPVKMNLEPPFVGLVSGDGLRSDPSEQAEEFALTPATE